MVKYILLICTLIINESTKRKSICKCHLTEKKSFINENESNLPLIDSYLFSGRSSLTYYVIT